MSGRVPIPRRMPHGFLPGALWHDTVEEYQAPGGGQFLIPDAGLFTRPTLPHSRLFSTYPDYHWQDGWLDGRVKAFERAPVGSRATPGPNEPAPPPASRVSIRRRMPVVCVAT